MRRNAEELKVAVIIPCHEVADLVRAAVGSVLEQTHRDLDIVAIDDGSGDGTLAVLREIERTSEGRLSVIAQSNAGASAARNAGLAATQGEWVQFLDADDILLPDKIARQLQIAQRSRIDVVVGTYRNRYSDGTPEELVLPFDGDPWEALVRTRLGTTSANLFRRDALLAAGGWDEALQSSQDYELLFRVLKTGARVAYDVAVGCDVLKRKHGSISRTNERENWLRYLDLRCAMRDHLRTLGPAHAGTVAIADQYLFMAIRVLSKHDRSAAFNAFDRMLPTDFMPEQNKATTRAYQRAFRWLGFRNAERLAGLIAGTKQP